MRFAFTDDQLAFQETRARLPARRSARPSACARSGRARRGRSPDALGAARRDRAAGPARARGARRPRPRRDRPRAAPRGDRPRRARRAGRRRRPRSARRSSPSSATPTLAARWLPRVAAGEALLAVGHRRERRSSPTRTSPTCCCSRTRRRAPRRAPARRRGSCAQPANDPSRRLFARELDAARARRASPAASAARRCSPPRSTAARSPPRRSSSASAEQLLEMAVDYACAAPAVRRADRLVPGGEAPSRRTPKVRARVRAPARLPRRVVGRARRSRAARSTSRWRRPRRPRRRPSPRAAALQCHGAIGYTCEHDLHLWMRRAWALDLAWGARALHRDARRRRRPGPGRRARPEHHLLRSARHGRGLHRRRRPHPGRASAAAGSRGSTRPTSARTCSARWSSAPASTRAPSRT